jgi:hypothetical protein
MNPYLADWSNYYVITGSAAAGLTGLMFVVITLVAGQERFMKNMRDGVETFSSPTVVHFCAALLVSAILAAPWHSLLGPSVVLTLIGLSGFVYGIRILWRMAHRSDYRPGFDDWFWYAGMPVVAYLAILAAGVALSTNPEGALFALAAGTIALIYTGIRNAWDIVTFIAVEIKSTDQPPD